MFFKENLRYIRKKSGMTQEEFSKMLGYSSRDGEKALETGKSQPTLEILIKLKEKYNYTLDDLIYKNIEKEGI